MSVPQNLNDCQYIWIVETTKGAGFNCDMFFYNEFGAKERRQTLLVQRDYLNDEVRIRKCIIDNDIRRVVLAQAQEYERLKIEAEAHYKKIFDNDMINQKDIDFWARQIDFRVTARDVLLKIINAKLEDIPK